MKNITPESAQLIVSGIAIDIVRKDIKNLQLVLNEWYREQLKKRIPGLLSRWQENIGVSSQDWGVKKMKTKWGSCNIAAKRIWLNLELAKKPPECLEYIIVHELVHLLERHHNDRFRAHMDRFMPSWQIYRDILDSSLLGHEAWRS